MHAFSLAQVLEQVHQHFHRFILLQTGFRKIYENIQGLCAATGLAMIIENRESLTRYIIERSNI